ncbi:MAG: class D sortase [Anaerolineales bacterium]|nr:class D sortase [Anaerolineales bacterium]MCK5794253.1 class D sortase [Anaerolineales bacterium]
MAQKKDPRDLSINELRRLLIEKQRSGRNERIERYRETGRVVRLVSDEEETSWEDIRTTSPVGEGPPDPVAEEKKRNKRVVDGFLLAIEVLAVLGLVFVLFNGLDILQQLNREVALALEQPTLTATPLIRAVVLPGGHTPPDSPGGSQPNIEEIPEHLRPVVQSYWEIPIPTPGPNHAIRLQIPKINKDVPVVEGDGPEQLKKGVGHAIYSANPGEIGNVVLSAHNDIQGEIFRNLDQLEEGDLVILFSERKSYTYVVEDVLIVEPHQVEFLESTDESIATLISCFPYRIDNQRIIVIANLIEG